MSFEVITLTIFLKSINIFIQHINEQKNDYMQFGHSSNDEEKNIPLSEKIEYVCVREKSVSKNDCAILHRMPVNSKEENNTHWTKTEINQY